MSLLHQWALDWGVHAAALQDLQRRMGLLTPSGPDEVGPSLGKSEAWAQSAIRLEASQKGFTMFRNNNGALKNPAGRLVRFGLGNDSEALNNVLKSADLIGPRPMLIQPHHVGHIIGQFVSREVKEPGWQYTGDGREVAQLNWANFVNSMGGDAAFATGPGTL